MAAVRPLAILCVGLMLAVARPAFGFHTIFHFQVDRFEAERRVFGRGRRAGLVDDFTGESTAQLDPLFGTVSVADGLLNIQNPGEHFSVGFPVDVSEVWSDAVVSLPLGGVTLTSYWVAPTLTPGSSLHMTLALTGTDGHDEYIGLHVQNTSADGPAVGLHFLELAGQDWQPLQVESVPYDQAATSDRIALRLVLDGGMVTGSFSLDGGATFTSPFTPGVVLPHMVSGRLMLGAIRSSRSRRAAATAVQGARPAIRPAPERQGRARMRARSSIATAMASAIRAMTAPTSPTRSRPTPTATASATPAIRARRRPTANRDGAARSSRSPG
jgi:hypothetical protein